MEVSFQIIQPNPINLYLICLPTSLKKSMLSFFISTICNWFILIQQRISLPYWMPSTHEFKAIYCWDSPKLIKSLFLNFRIELPNYKNPDGKELILFWLSLSKFIEPVLQHIFFSKIDSYSISLVLISQLEPYNFLHFNSTSI